MKILFAASLLLGGLLFYQNCSQPSELGITSIQELSTESNILVYDDTESDQKFLQEKIRGYRPPGMAEIFERWATFSGTVFYPNAAAIQIEESLQYCTSGQRDLNGDFLPVTDPLDQRKRAPTSIAACNSSKAFNAKSWTVVENPQRLYTPVNSSYLVGFISPVDFDNYTHDVVLSSKNTDDDAIMSIVAFNRDEEGVLDVLAAVRNQGGWIKSGSWSIVHFRNGLIVKTFDNLILNDTNRNVGYKRNAAGAVVNDSAGKPIILDPGSGDTRGWNTRKAVVRVTRKKNIIQAWASSFSEPGVVPTAADLKEDSLIQIDLEDSKNELEIFRGPKPYGYASYSQSGSEYLSDRFEANTNVQIVYDLKSGAVYTRQPDGTYAILPGVDAITKIGYPRKVSNPETGKVISIKWDRVYKAL
ncbi:MAG: hypothetical protein JNM39_14250 [Bdellovibrionaceae bacterium]|nr:hypothetical protein [Pseudobdellovibrionaceae bacterium]